MAKKIFIYIKKNSGLNNFSINHTIFVIALIVGFVFTIIVGSFAENTQTNIANNLIRLHVVANSDLAADQALKIKVRDAITKEMTSKFQNSKDINQTRQIAYNNLDNITRIANEVIKESGNDYNIKVNIEKTYFPTKYYGDMVFPPGLYEAVKVEIGEAKGENWWCVLFPPLCFIDATNGSVPDASKEKLRSSLTQDEYELLTASTNDKVPVKIKFKSVEVWQSSKHNVQVAIKKIF